MLILFTIVHVIVCLFLIIVILLQSGKAADLAGAFGGMGSQTAFGPRGSATLLSKATTISAAIFMVTSLSLSILATRNSGASTSTVLDKAGSKQSAPVTPGAQQKAPAAPVPVNPAAPASNGKQPSVTLTPENGGPSKTIPLQMPKQGQAPAPAPAKK